MENLQLFGAGIEMERNFLWKRKPLLTYLLLLIPYSSLLFCFSCFSLLSDKFAFLYDLMYRPVHTRALENQVDFYVGEPTRQ